MDKDTRGGIQRATQAARRLLEDEFSEQLGGVFDVRADGSVPAEAGAHLREDPEALRVRGKLVSAVQHHRAQGLQAPDAVGALLRECAFTTLNRFVALKMLEARGIVQECVSRGPASSGFKNEFVGLAPGLATLPDKGYRLYLDSLFDEIGREVRVLFDRRDPASLLWPRGPALDALLALLNAPELAGVWAQDETIGWVYQYFNGDDERRQMRKESQAPRNSRELAVRNQFFTPRYVVEFLTDNTLARTWVEMRQGQTRLLDECRYLVRRKDEVFLAEGEAAPEVDEDVPIEERTVYVPYRSKKDPRDIKVLDPASGSGHFLLYAFDVLLTIYEEAWHDPDSPGSAATGRRLVEDFATRDALALALPGLILRHNLYGVDIDPRAAQIAALALWMRAQRAWNDFGVRRADRPLVTRTHVVVAEPMPGEADLLEELCAGLDPGVAGIVRAVFEDMKLAGEAGTLLRIEETVRQGLEKVAKRGALFAREDAERWGRVEGQVYAALRGYAEAAGGAGYRRRLFAEDAARGFAFIEVCRRRYDVVLMNPPFGDAAKPALARLDRILSTCGRDVGASFVLDAAHRFARGGKVGVLLSTAPWFKPVFEGWRELVFFGDHCQLELAVHLGGEVLDGATVNASPIVLGIGSGEAAEVFRLSHTDDLQAGLLACIDALRTGCKTSETFRVLPSEACVLPGRPFSYWPSRSLRRRVAKLPPFEGNGGTVKQGTATADEFRFTRAWWEVSASSDRWIPYTKTSPYSPFWDDVTWVGNFGGLFRELAAFPRAYIRNAAYAGLPGVTYTSKSVLGFNPRLHPSGAAFGHTGSVVFPAVTSPLAMLGFLGSAPVEYLLSLFVGELQGKAGVHPNHYEVGTIQRLPWPSIDNDAAEVLGRAARHAVHALRCLDALDEVKRGFVSAVPEGCDTLASTIEALRQAEYDSMRAVCEARAVSDVVVGDAYGFTEHDHAEMTSAFAGRVPPATGKWRIYFGTTGTDIDPVGVIERVLSWALGVAIGRWSPVECRAPESPASAEVLVAPPSRPPLSAAVSFADLLPVPPVLADDPGTPCDVYARLMEALSVIYVDKVDQWVGDARDLIDPKASGLRSWLRSKFFGLHIKRYSKSRRKAPIYWQLGTPSASYSIWLYIHRVGPDTLHAVLRDHVGPKLRFETDRLSTLRSEAGDSPAPSQRKAIDAQQSFVDELLVFRDELRRVAPLWAPELDDGVVINASFLHRLFAHTRSWQTECEKHWKKLQAGEFDWAHLAMRLWPERVVPKCAEDRSLAIAHDLEDEFWWQDEDGKWQPAEVDEARIGAIVKERTRPAVRDALRQIAAAPPPPKASRKSSRRPSTPPRKARAPAPAPPTTQLALDLSAPAPASDSAVLDALRAALATFPDGAGRAELLAASGIEQGWWSAAISVLVERGDVVRTGKKRGTRYHLARRP